MKISRILESKTVQGLAIMLIVAVAVLLCALALDLYVMRYRTECVESVPMFVAENAQIVEEIRVNL